MSLVKVENVKASSENTILDGVSFEINEKGVYAILGKSLEEKTMLARVLAGTLKINEGNIFYREEEFCGKKQIDLKAKLGYLPRKCFLDPDMTVYEALDFTGRMRGTLSDKRIKQIKEALELLELSSLSEALVSDLNESEKKKLLLANSLIGNPRVIILDDPTLGVFSNDFEIICDVISMLGEKKVVILFTEKVLVANDLADHIGILSNGKMVLWSSLENIKERLCGDSDALVKTFVAFSAESGAGR